jgi:hypothetical protein
MKKLCIFSTLVILIAASSVIAEDVRYNFDQDASFATYKTYKWVPIKDAAKVSSLVDKQIKSAIATVLATKGLTEIEDDNADLFVGYQAAVSEEKQFSSYSTGWGTGPGYRGGWYGGGGMQTTTGQTSTIYIGAIGFDMYDAAKKNLVWRGMVSKTIDQKAKPDKQQKNLAKAMQKLLKNYPPPVKK